MYIHVWARFGEGNGTPLQYSCLGSPMGGGAWQAAVHGVARSRTRLSDFTFAFHFSALEKEMATHSSVLAWRIPGTGEPGGLMSMGSHKVGHDLRDLVAAAWTRLQENKHFYIVLVKKRFNFSRRQFCSLPRDNLYYCHVPFGKYNDAIIIKIYVCFHCENGYQKCFITWKRQKQPEFPK